MYRFTDKQRRQLLEDALVTDLLEASLTEERSTDSSAPSGQGAAGAAPRAGSARGQKALE